MKTDLAIIVPVLNCLDYTKQMIPTIKTKRPYNLIFVDNASTDGTIGFLRSLEKENKAHVLYQVENIGVGPAWNLGIKHAVKHFGSRYFFIPNNDVILHPNCIDMLLEALGDPSVALAGANDVSGEVARALDILTLSVPPARDFVDTPDFSCFATKKSTIDKIGYFDEKFFPAYFEDNDYHYRIGLAGLRGVKANCALYFHFGSRAIKESVDIKEIADLGFAANRDYFRRKWGGLPGHETHKVPFGGKA